MDMKCEEEFKVELVENTEEEDDKKINIHLEQLLTFEEIQERNWYESIDMKNEIEVKEEPFDIEEEEATNEKLLDQICGLDQNQVQIKSFKKLHKLTYCNS
ncbi:UNVERIFIED_CONTAM: hypothetical protein RMT77_017478 [Armadillidium vulgare]